MYATHTGRNLFFLHVPKTAGRSIEALVRRHAGFRRCPVYSTVTGTREEMTTLTILDFCKKYFPALLHWPAVRTFTFVRHPCTRLYSGFLHARRDGWLPAKLPFRDFVLGYPDNEACYRSPRDVLWHTWCSQYQMLGSAALADRNFVGRYERLVLDTCRLLRWLAVDPGQVRRLPHIGYAPAGDAAVYDAAMLAVVAERFADDFEVFSYAVPAANRVSDN